MQVNFTINIDDRLVKGVKAFFKKRSVIITATILLITTLSLVYAQTTTGTERIIFQTGQVIKASDLNYNFETLWAGSGGGGSTIPVGTILPYVGNSLPDPELWLWCDGNSFDANEFPELYTRLGNRADTPDLRGRVIAGKLAMDSSDNRVNDANNPVRKRLDISWANSSPGYGASPDKTSEEINDWETRLYQNNIPFHTHQYYHTQFNSTYKIHKTSVGDIMDYTQSPAVVDPYTDYIWSWADSSLHQLDITDPDFIGPEDPDYVTNPDNKTKKPHADPFNIVQPTVVINFIIRAKSTTTTDE